MHKWIKDYFSFSKRERTAVIILLALMALLLFLPYCFTVNDPAPLSPQLSEDLAKVQQLLTAPITDSIGDGPADRLPAAEIRLQAFDPNRATLQQWMVLGLTQKTAGTIMNYLSKGGRFKTPEDIRKIWGLSKTDADRIIPYAHITAPAAVSYNSYREKKTSVIDINTATIAEWEALPGIGPAFASRIMRYREKAGGFTTIADIRNTYGLPDSVYQKIVPYLRFNSAQVPKHNLNYASIYDLMRRAHIPEEPAKAIVSYRQQNGPFAAMQELKKVPGITDSLCKIIAGFFIVE